MFLNDCLWSGCVKAWQHPNTWGNVGGLGRGDAAQCEFSRALLFLHENHLETNLCKSWVIHIILYTGEDGGRVSLLWLDQHEPWTRSNTCSHLAHRGGLQDHSHLTSFEIRLQITSIFVCRITISMRQSRMGFFFARYLVFWSFGCCGWCVFGFFTWLFSIWITFSVGGESFLPWHSGRTCDQHATKFRLYPGYQWD